MQKFTIKCQRILEIYLEFKTERLKSSKNYLLLSNTECFNVSRFGVISLIFSYQKLSIFENVPEFVQSSPILRIIIVENLSMNR